MRGKAIQNMCLGFRVSFLCWICVPFLVQAWRSSEANRACCLLVNSHNLPLLSSLLTVLSYSLKCVHLSSSCFIRRLRGRARASHQIRKEGVCQVAHSGVDMLVQVHVHVHVHVTPLHAAAASRRFYTLVPYLSRYVHALS